MHRVRSQESGDTVVKLAMHTADVCSNIHARRCPTNRHRSAFNRIHISCRQWFGKACEAMWLDHRRQHCLLWSLDTAAFSF